MSVLAIDLGKTNCRVTIGDHGAVGPGFPGLADSDGVARALSVVRAAAALIEGEARPEVTAVGAGVAGVEAAPRQAQELADALAAEFEVPVALAGDAVSAHAGAFRGARGTIVVVGTGTVLITSDGAGSVRQVDGWGPWLGDEGSGRWIGQEGLRAVLAAADGRGSATTLTAAAEALHRPLSEMPWWISATGSPARRLASFAPAVLAAAAAGDEVARTIVERATDAVVAACRATTGPYCLVGGVVDDPQMRRRVEDALVAGGAETRPPLGDALSGARYLAESADAYARSVIRRGRP